MLRQNRKIIQNFRQFFAESKYISVRDFAGMASRIARPTKITKLIIKYFARYRVKHNQKFISKMQQDGLTCAGCALDRQQVEAVVACEDAQLVLASAGSGKTLSLLAKIEYLNRNLRIPATQILAISFTKKTVDELVERCAVKNVEFRTFHGLGNKILRSVPSELGAKTLVSENEIAQFFSQKIPELCARNLQFVQLINDYILFYFSAPSNPGVFENFASRINFNHQFLRRALKDEVKVSKEHQILNGDFIRSKEEQLIANWLFIHQINYAYQKQYSYTQTKYRPTFSCEDFYIDVLQINHDGTSPQGREYLREVKWRRKIHAKNHTNYIEIHSGDWESNQIFVKLEAALRALKIKFVRLSEGEIFTKIQASASYREDYLAFLRQLQTFLSLHKNANYTKTEVLQRVIKGDVYAKMRARSFLKIYFCLADSYAEYLEDNRKYDFADMINDATRAVEDYPEIAKGYRYILLDEVQDLSRNRFLLVRAILRKNPGCKLFAVGDDWQSIYRFTGSDLTLIQEFEQTFGLATRRSLIETTHRFGLPTITLSSEFVQKNPTQSHKNVFNIQDKPTPIYVILNRPKFRTNDAESLNIILQNLIQQHGYPAIREKSFQIISRFNHDIKRLQESENLKIQTSANGTADILWHNPKNSAEELKLEFCSMHKSKGITRDIVIVLNMNSDLMGMPALRESDPITDSLLSHEDDFAFAEERRLFYVAITRAREATFIIANRKNPSPFIFEISQTIKEAYGKLCPKCGTGELIRKHGKSGDFFYCSNYRFGCNYVQK